MSESHLTENQRRHLAIHVHLLEEDLVQLRQLPELRQAATHDRLHAAMLRVEVAARRIAEAFDLPVRIPVDACRRVRAVANIWAARIPELRAARLRGYGPVHPQLASRLDPLVGDLTHHLFALAEAAATSAGEGERC